MKKHKGSSLILTILATTLVCIISICTLKIYNLEITTFNSSKKSLQAKQYAESKMELLKLVGFNNLKESNWTNIANSDFKEKILLSPILNEGDGINSRLVTVKIAYKSESTDRYSLERKFYNVSPKEFSNTKSFYINRNGSASFIAPCNISNISLVCITDFTRNDNGSVSGKNTITISDVCSFSIQASVSKTGSKGHGWAYPGSKSFTQSYKVNIPKGKNIVISTLSSGNWPVESTSILLLLS